MSARERLLAALTVSPEVRPGEAEQLLADLAAEAAPTDRQAVLREAIERWPGEWTPARVNHVYCAAGITVPRRKARRNDLAYWHRKGLLVLDEQSPNRRVYTLSTCTGEA